MYGCRFLFLPDFSLVFIIVLLVLYVRMRKCGPLNNGMLGLFYEDVKETVCLVDIILSRTHASVVEIR